MSSSTPAGQSPSLLRSLLGIAVVIFFLVVIMGSCDDDEEVSTSSDATTTARPTATTTKRPYDHQVMPGNGYHNMGGIDGKDWGVWRSSGAPTECNWSIRLTSPYTGATILNEGQAPAGQSTRVNIQPPGDVSSISGEIDGGRVLFQTSGCGAWELERW